MSVTAKSCSAAFNRDCSSGAPSSLLRGDERRIGGYLRLSWLPVTQRWAPESNQKRLPNTLATLSRPRGHTWFDLARVKGGHLTRAHSLVFVGSQSPVGIHGHDYGGHTCVVSGEIAGGMKGHPPTQWPAGTCCSMPPHRLMAAADLGTEDPVLIDTFILPPVAPTITIREPGWPEQ